MEWLVVLDQVKIAQHAVWLVGVEGVVELSPTWAQARVAMHRRRRTSTLAMGVISAARSVISLALSQAAVS